MRRKHLLLVLFVAGIWGVNFSVIKIGLDSFPPLLFSALRFAVVALPAVFFVPRPRTPWPKVVSVGLFLGTIKFGLLFVAMDGRISAGLAALLLQAQAVFTVVLSAVVFRERLGRSQLAGGCLALAGFSLFIASTGGTSTHEGLLLVLLAALAWTIANLIMKKVDPGDLFRLIVWSSLIPPIPLLAMSIALEGPEPMRSILEASPDAWWAVAFSGLVSTLVAFAIWGRLLATYAAARVTPFALLVPVVAMAVSRFWLDERFNRIEWIGAVCLLLGIGAISLGGRRRLGSSDVQSQQHSRLACDPT